jgi:hypothetical protein
MQNWQRAIGTASLCLVVMGGAPLAALAAEPEMKPIYAVNPILVSAPISTEISGTVLHQDIEGGFYTVDGYRLVGEDDQFGQYLNLQVKVTGSFSDEVSIQMVKAFEVNEIKLLQDQTITGELTWIDLEGGYYAVDGVRLIADSELLKQYAGKLVTVQGTVNNEPSIQMVRAIDVEKINLVPAQEQQAELEMVQADRNLPATITWKGKAIHFGQDPTVLKGNLMIPVRDLVQGLGGKVKWDGRSQTVTVELSDRMAYFVVGELKAEMNENGVRYLARNLISLAQAPSIIKGHVYISADALSTVLGLLEVDGQSDTMQLIAAKVQAPEMPKRPADAWGAFSGTVKELGDGPSILVSGQPLQNGDLNSVWAEITRSTVIVFSEESGEQPASSADLTVGQQVIVDMAGPMTTSYPAHVNAAKIVIER